MSSIRKGETSGSIPVSSPISTKLPLSAATRQLWSARGVSGGEAAVTFNRRFNIRQDLWGYPSTLSPGIFPLNPIERKSDTLDYGIGTDYRLFEDCVLTMQAQQTVILDHSDALYEHQVETLLWGNVKNGWMNQKIETNLNIAFNPEHGDIMIRANAWYVFTDAWKAGLSAATFNGPSQSIFGRFSRNDQVEGEVVYSW